MICSSHQKNTYLIVQNWKRLWMSHCYRTLPLSQALYFYSHDAVRLPYQSRIFHCIMVHVFCSISLQCNHTFIIMILSHNDLGGFARLYLLKTSYMQKSTQESGPWISYLGDYRWGVVALKCFKQTAEPQSIWGMRGFHGFQCLLYFHRYVALVCLRYHSHVENNAGSFGRL